MLRQLLKAMRPQQWVKNVLIFAPLVFDLKLFDLQAEYRVFLGFVLFCLISSTIYLINDITDLEADRQHPRKRHRPLAAGKLSVSTARNAAILYVVISLPLAAILSPVFASFALAYLILNLAYSFTIKHIPILDVLMLAMFYVLRVGAGVSLVEVTRFSPWIYTFTLFLALLIGIGKRRGEMTLLADGANMHRRVLDGYTIPFLDQMIVLASALTVMTYSLYTFFAPNLPENNTMMLTIPFVIYGVFRYVYLIQVEKQGGSPVEILYRDRPIQGAVALWGLAVLLIFYLFS